MSGLSRLASARAQHKAEQLGREHEVLVRRTLEDPLTGLGNRRALDECLDDLASRVGADVEVAMVVLDVDHFKRINDLHGHVAGDRVLARVGSVLATSLRPGDVAVRLGGDEFCAVLVGAPGTIVEERAERIRQVLTEQEWGAVASGLSVGVSVGAATCVGPSELAIVVRPRRRRALRGEASRPEPAQNRHLRVSARQGSRWKRPRPGEQSRRGRVRTRP